MEAYCNRLIPIFTKLKKRLFKLGNMFYYKQGQGISLISKSTVGATQPPIQ
jgi:hypothetical protein